MAEAPTSLATRLRRLGGLIAVNVVVLLVLLAVVEAAFRVVDPSYAFYARSQPGQYEDRTFGARHWPRKDADLGWVLSEGAPDFYTPEGLQPPAYTANAQGFRDVKDFESVDDDPDRTRVMMLGDSFLFAVHLAAADAIPVQLERRMPGHRVFNLGMPGWGVDQMYLAYRKYAGRIQPHVVVLCYIDDDLRRSYEAFRSGEGMNKPSFALDGGRLALRTHPTPPPEWLASLIGLSSVANRLYVAYAEADQRRLARAVFTALIEETRSRGARLLVVRLPTRSDLPDRAWPDLWNLQPFFAANDVAFLDPLPAMSGRDDLFLPGDEHLSALGTAHIAEILSGLEVLQAPAAAQSAR